MQQDPRAPVVLDPPKTPWLVILVVLAAAGGGAFYYFRPLLKKEEAPKTDETPWQNPMAEFADSAAAPPPPMTSAEFQRKFASLAAAASASSGPAAPDPQTDLRHALEAKVDDGSATVAELRMLSSICKLQKDRACEARVKAAIKGD